MWNVIFEHPSPSLICRRQRGVPYTDEEDKHLVKYLAEVCPVDVPYVSSRLAMTIYKNLVANVRGRPLLPDVPPTPTIPHSPLNIHGPKLILRSHGVKDSRNGVMS